MEKLTATFRTDKTDVSLGLPQLAYNILRLKLGHNSHVEMQHYSSCLEILIFDLTYEDIKNLRGAITKAESELMPEGIK